MLDPRIEKLASMLVNYSVGVKSGDRVLIRANPHAQPLTKAVFKAALLAGGFPYVALLDPEYDEILYNFGSDEQIRYLHAPYLTLWEEYETHITIKSAANTKLLTSVPSEKVSLHWQGLQPLYDSLRNRTVEETLRWTSTIYPTNALAQDAEMSLTEYEDFYFRACMPDLDDPVGYWQRFSARQQKVIDWLAGKEVIRVIAPETDLQLRVNGRSWINSDSHANVPDGEVYTSPVEDSVNGYVYFSYPSIKEQREVSGIRLQFEHGTVIKATAEKNEAFLNRLLDTDEGARRVGEFAIGTNESITRFTREILFDEKISGSFHMAMGFSYPETGGLNESAIHWDMICDLRAGGEIWADGQLAYQDGRFVISP